MAEVAEADFLLAARGASRELGAWVVNAVFGREGRSLGFALADGTVHMTAPARMNEDWTRIEAHDGAVLSATADCKDGLLSGGDDGRLLRIGADGSAAEVARYGSKWIDHVIAHESGVRAASVGKLVHVLEW